MISIRVKLIKLNKDVQVEASPDSTVRDLKLSVEKLTKVEPLNQKLVFCGKVLSDSQTLNQQGVVQDSVIQLLSKRSIAEANVAAPPPESHFVTELQRSLKPHFTAADSKLIIANALQLMNSCAEQASLEAIDNFAAALSEKR